MILSKYEEDKGCILPMQFSETSRAALAYMGYEGQRPVGFYWVHLEGIVELSISPQMQKKIADTGLKWISSAGGAGWFKK